MKTLAVNEEFRPMDLGLHETWGFIVEDASGDSELEVFAEGEWRPVKTFDADGNYVDTLRRDALYRFSAIEADAITVY